MRSTKAAVALAALSVTLVLSALPATATETHASDLDVVPSDILGDCNQYNGFTVALEDHPAGQGTWIVQSDGGVFALNGAPFYGSAGALPLNQPIIDIAVTSDGDGYWLLARDGGVFTYGNAFYYGNATDVYQGDDHASQIITAPQGGYYIRSTGDIGVYRGPIVNAAAVGGLVMPADRSVREELPCGLPANFGEWLESLNRANESRFGGPGWFEVLVERYFQPDDWRWATRVAQCESGFNPYASNGGRYLGLFQHMASGWAGRAAAAGFPGAAWYDAEANVAAAAWLFYQGNPAGNPGPWECR